MKKLMNSTFLHWFEDGTKNENTIWDLAIFKADILEAKRETMNDSLEDETEFGPNDQDKEMLVTSAAWTGNCSLVWQLCAAMMGWVQLWVELVVY